VVTDIEYKVEAKTEYVEESKKRKQQQ